MDSEKDAYGHIIMNHFKKLQSFEVVERSDGYVNAYDGAKEYFSGFKDWSTHEKKAIKFAKGRCLDIGCGAGRVALHLQKKKHSVIAIDNSPLAIKVCKLRGIKNAKVMGINRISSFADSAFDSILLFGYNFGLLQSEEKARKLLRTMHRITSPEAIIIAETRDPYMTDNAVHFKYHEMNKSKGRMPGQLHDRIRFMQYKSDWSDFLYVSKSEVQKLLVGTGWKIRTFIDSENYGKKGRYFAIMEKL